MYSCSQQSVHFWNRYNVSWPLRREPSSGRTVPTTAVCIVRELTQVWSHLNTSVHTIHVFLEELWLHQISGLHIKQCLYCTILRSLHIRQVPLLYKIGHYEGRETHSVTTSTPRYTEIALFIKTMTVNCDNSRPKQYKAEYSPPINYQIKRHFPHTYHIQVILREIRTRITPDWYNMQLI
jgi:hypothetical protein